MTKKELNSKNIPDAEISTANSTHNPQPATHNSLYTTHNPQSAIHNALPTTYNTQLTTINNLPTTPQKERIILGIDPGTAVMGYGLVREIGTKIELISLGVVKMDKIDDHMLKLQRIFEKTVALIDNYHPDCLAIEAPFYGKNIQVMLKLGRAQGVAMSAALSRNVTITEYSPRKIKQAITGNGNATKEQVAAMLQTLLKFTETPDFLDATDGLAVAVCHSFQRFPAGKTGSKKSYSGWDTFAKDNAGRVAGLTKTKK